MKESTKLVIKATTNILANLLFISILITVCLLILNCTYNRLDKYAEEHNCRYDYNGLCYTEEERPWLF